MILLPRNGHRLDPMDMDKVRYVFKNLVRDWSSEGAPERAMSYGRVTEAVRRWLPPPADPTDLSVQPPRVLVPGAGLGEEE